MSLVKTNKLIPELYSSPLWNCFFILENKIPYQAYSCDDGYVGLSNPLWSGFLVYIGPEEFLSWLQDAGSTSMDRLQDTKFSRSVFTNHAKHWKVPLFEVLSYGPHRQPHENHFWMLWFTAEAILWFFQSMKFSSLLMLMSLTQRKMCRS